MKRFLEVVEDIKRLGDQLIPYNYPLADTSLEDDLNPIKVCSVWVDGYYVTIYYSKAYHPNDGFILETVQIYGCHQPFLPFSLVIKIGREFLGSEKLALIEFMRLDKKVYCWTRYADAEGNPIDPPHDDVKHLQYQGFEYNQLSPSHVNFY